MARTKQVASGRRYNHKPKVFRDHRGNDYTVVGGTPSSCSNPSTIIKLSIHLYTLSDLQETPEEIGSKLLRSHGIVASGNLHNYWPRVDVYSPLGSIEECMEHHRAEKIYRKKAVEEMHREARVSADTEEDAEEAVRKFRGKQPLPHIVPTWACTERSWTQYSFGHGWRYRSVVLVVPEDCRCWDDVEEKGLWIVCFDQDVTPAMETHMWDCVREEDWEIDNGEGWVEVEKIEYGPPVLIKRVSVCREDQEPGERGDSTITDNLYDMWSQIVRVLNDCTYRTLCAMVARRMLPMTVSSTWMSTSLTKLQHVWPVDGLQNIDAGARGMKRFQPPNPPPAAATTITATHDTRARAGPKEATSPAPDKKVSTSSKSSASSGSGVQPTARASTRLQSSPGLRTRLPYRHTQLGIVCARLAGIDTYDDHLSGPIWTNTWHPCLAGFAGMCSAPPGYHSARRNFGQLPRSLGDRGSISDGNEDESTEEVPSDETAFKSQRGSVDIGNQDDEYIEGNLDDIDIDAAETGGFITTEDVDIFTDDDDDFIQEDWEDESEDDTLSTASDRVNPNDPTIMENSERFAIRVTEIVKTLLSLATHAGEVPKSATAFRDIQRHHPDALVREVLECIPEQVQILLGGTETKTVADLIQQLPHRKKGYENGAYALLGENEKPQAYATAN
ncbi:hypothetical protein CNMCM5793_005545 [Aspergillus hiratsukae]|uniref:Uncharacterized protein n=1 Tax=Aspergillus hiratsukae TaxID=1194566 RepID=A0A8H6QDY8_9EURO|nr:hypothetical protein CNMCM5793_005545 [Aspergillus hiratsukae]KAF7171218.1 hypothetical protein CNMCM6106_005658 [Aspergillus hiratsukae]